MGVDLVGLANSAALNEAAHVSGESRPPVVVLYRVNGPVVTAMTARRRVMDDVEKVVPVGVRHISPIFEVKDGVVVSPVMN